MKYYSYFPGCSLSEGTAVAYGISTRAISSVLDMELIELEDWNCCGSTPIAQPMSFSRFALQLVIWLWLKRQGLI